jgi:hypothetical protein
MRSSWGRHRRPPTRFPSYQPLRWNLLGADLGHTTCSFPSSNCRYPPRSPVLCLVPHIDPSLAATTITMRHLLTASSTTLSFLAASSGDSLCPRYSSTATRCLRRHWKRLCSTAYRHGSCPCPPRVANRYGHQLPAPISALATETLPSITGGIHQPTQWTLIQHPYPSPTRPPPTPATRPSTLPSNSSISKALSTLRHRVPKTSPRAA